MVPVSAVFSTVLCCALMRLITVFALMFGEIFVCLSNSVFCDGLPLVLRCLVLCLLWTASELTLILLR